MATTATTRSGFVSDTRGAVMMTGLFLSFFLIGALWFVIGIANAVVFRDRMQEAADHAAFSSAALHAKGMNFIAACNLVMLALVIVHIVLGLLHDIALATCIVSLGGACGVWVSARKVYTGWSDLMKPVMNGLHLVEKAAAYGYPWVGLVTSIDVGSMYGKQGSVGDIDVFAVSPSMIPDVIVPDSVNVTKVGLPVAAKPMGALCDKVFDWAFAKVVEHAGYAIGNDGNLVLDGICWASGGRYGCTDKDKILEKFKKMAQDTAMKRYCNPLSGGSSQPKEYDETINEGNKKLAEEHEKAVKKKKKDGTYNPQVDDAIPHVLSKIDPGFNAFWGENGPLYVADGAKNGHVFMQVWALNVRPRLKDSSEQKVKIASRQMDGTNVEDGPLGYFAQAEFYFDCKDEDVSPPQAATWGADQCNGDAVEANASFSLKWKARLRRVALPEFGKLVGGYLYQLTTGNAFYEHLRKVVTKDNPVFERLANGGLIGEAFLDELSTMVETKVTEGEAAYQDALNNGAQDVHDRVFDGVYH